MKGYLHLEDGSVYTGELEHGSSKDINGEIVFFTGMSGYQEVLTDPSYKNQIVVFTYPLIGNYGINISDDESKKPQVKAVVIYECTSQYSHYEAQYSFKEYLEKWNIPIIHHIDTRAVVKKIRNHGSMAATITSKSALSEKPSTIFEDGVFEVVSDKLETYGNGEKHIALVDFGYKKSILTSLLDRGCKVTTVPFKMMDQIGDLKPDGVLLSNGPGDPEQLSNYFNQIKKVVSAYPTLGICLGHQLIALSFGAKTTKLLFGHRGANQPVFDLKTNKVFMTSQNHSYVVIKESLKDTDLSMRFYHINDDSIEGLSHKSLPVLTAQFHPEAHPGPSDSEWIFDEFLELVAVAKGDILYV
ncbi:carbamoyl phosphate synthase small subunit [Metabacillus halosaccharovorans]|uniref:Carbamoyl phosphate synthase small chain n=1 Tax=Metabacillus halosaccharovorans TaxID=930124 RepID=A0ABT3DJ40_9BACI|nr:carbamoyl phosphate synthase small subunit [Metabacillus halosaccharovorans]MCV9887069.1 carbamoyl phosphate synthase small subunit [Metabacillus halosaccharovorans]